MFVTLCSFAWDTAYLESGVFSTLEVCIMEHSMVQFVWGPKLCFTVNSTISYCVVLPLFKDL